MILLLLQVLGFAALAVYFGFWRAGNRRRNNQSWDSLLGQLRVDWSARDLSDNFLWKDSLNATAEDAWQRMEGPRGLWVMFQNAKVMLQMADFVARNHPEVDRLTVETLRSDAMQIRLCVLMGLAQYGFNHASEGVKVNAYRAASMYASMATRLTALLQDHAGDVLPDFVAAM